jgi:7-cyano-7-deazaguanine reductase
LAECPGLPGRIEATTGDLPWIGVWRYNKPMKPIYTDHHASAGLDAKLPTIYTFPSQYKKYEIQIEVPEFTSICPKTGLPDYGNISIRYEPRKNCVELKSFKMYVMGYRNLGIFNENVVNRMLEDLVKAVNPVWAEVSGTFNPRGGIDITVTARYPRK